jgi:ferrous iron transport protein A
MQCELNQLAAGESGSIVDIDADEALYFRLHALGFRMGRSITVIRHGNFKGPLQVALGTTHVIIRRNDAAKITVHRNA